MDRAGQRSREPERLLLRPGKRNSIFLLTASTGFVLIGLLMIHVGGPMPRAPAGDARVWGWIAVIFFGLGIPLSLFQLFSNRFNLVLTPDSFSVGTLLGTRTIRWRDVAEFSAQVMAYRSWPLKPVEMVRYKMTPGSGQRGGFLGTYSMSAESLAEMMNTWRRRYSG